MILCYLAINPPLFLAVYTGDVKLILLGEILTPLTGANHTHATLQGGFRHQTVRL
ncbi:Uncharacterised protein [Vibrio cholerae]|nr:Uncharacterised protein [Vibrio cholerae]